MNLAMLLAQSSSKGSGAAGAIMVIILVALYFTPTVVAAIRRVPNIGSVIVINLFLGWSIIGWIVALAMAARSTPPAQQVVLNQSLAPSVPAVPPPPVKARLHRDHHDRASAVEHQQVS